MTLQLLPRSSESPLLSKTVLLEPASRNWRARVEGDCRRAWHSGRATFLRSRAVRQAGLWRAEGQADRQSGLHTIVGERVGRFLTRSNWLTRRGRRSCRI